MCHLEALDTALQCSIVLFLLRDNVCICNKKHLK